MFGSAMARRRHHGRRIVGGSSSELPARRRAIMRVLSGASLTTSGFLPPGTITAWVAAAGIRLGHRESSAASTSTATAFQEIAFSSPGFDGASGTDTGEITSTKAAPGGVSLAVTTCRRFLLELLRPVARRARHD